MKIVVTGSSGLIGSEAVRYFGTRGHKIIGVDCNLRKFFFGAEGDTTWNLKLLKDLPISFNNHEIDIRNRGAVLDLYKNEKPDATIHCAAQPSHDLAAKMPFEDFDTNAAGTINLLEANRRYSLDSPFLFTSTNKVYGDAPNELKLIETSTRWDYADSRYANGIAEDFRIDRTKHSLFGASKVAADIMTQEYGKYFNMPTVCFRGGCLTGPSHSGVELHGFLQYIVKCAIINKPYTIFGYKGKQVRDQIHSEDVVRAFEQFIENPRAGEVYNLGGGRDNSASILEVIALIEGLIKSHYPKWNITHSLHSIVEEIINSVKK